jgi:hypothetical protein
MQSLTPFEPGEAGPRGATAAKVPWLSIVVALSVVLAGLVLMNWREVADTLRRHTVLQAELAVCGGTLVGLFLSRMEVGPLTRKRLATLDQLYEGAAVSPVFLQSGYTHYLPCVLLLQDNDTADLTAVVRSRSEAALLKDAVGGILYVGPAGVVLRTTGGDAGEPTRRAKTDWFAALRRLSPFTSSGSRRARQCSPDRIEMGSVRQVTAASIALPQGQLARVARASARHAMYLRWPTGQAILAIPAIADTLPRLHRCFDELRWGVK